MPISAVVSHDIRDYTALAIVRHPPYNFNERSAEHQTDMRLNNIVSPPRDILQVPQEVKYRNMKRHWIEYNERWKRGPMSFWVHIPADDKHWSESQEFNPPAPKPLAGRGYPYYFVEIDGFIFEFASLAELRVLLETFSKKLLPSNLRLSIERGANYGPSNHWLNRIPKETTSWRYREKAVKYLQRALADFETETS